MKDIIAPCLVSLVLFTAVAAARPVDRDNDLRPEVPANPEAPFQGSLSSARGIALAPAVCVAGDTVEYGGTFWAADSIRWEALRDSVWTFDTGVGSALNTGSNPNKPIGYHRWMEGWFGIDQTLNPLPYFRRHATCKINGGFSLWAGVTLAEANSLCFASGQGYGNNWNMEVRKTFAYPGTGNATLSYKYTHEIEDNFDFAYALIDTSGTGAADDIELVSYTGSSGGIQTESINLIRGSSLRTSAGNVILKFFLTSDGSYSDEDGLNATTCGAFVEDDITLTGAII
jgi:hypothetical protein